MSNFSERARALRIERPWRATIGARHWRRKAGIGTSKPGTMASDACSYSRRIWRSRAAWRGLSFAYGAKISSQVKFATAAEGNPARAAAANGNEAESDATIETPARRRNSASASSRPAFRRAIASASARVRAQSMAPESSIAGPASNDWAKQAKSRGNPWRKNSPGTLDFIRMRAVEGSAPRISIERTAWPSPWPET
ncbi:MAG: hypothetical protein BWZ10_00768 [candidate division BRC1 bacterium ADurb.BinA364]|nr:MAG: hypothetical protein BWZ10_00768 [candidate division BRC1 bacterium ADurb.BinA364]